MYSVFDPFQETDSSEGAENIYRYKNPVIYQNGAYLPDAETKGKYSDDIFTKFATDFIKQNITNPFFLYFSFSECHKPYSPPPSSPDFQTWDPQVNQSNKKYFPDMVSYMDSKISTIINAVNSQGLSDNTYILIFGDNGTAPEIVSKYNGRNIKGGKGVTNEFGLHVPLLVIGPSIQPNSVCRDIVDFTDFMPTIASLANVPQIDWPNYGIMDGKTFHKKLLGTGNVLRKSSYGYYFPNSRIPSQKRIYVQDTVYKLYDISNNNNFYNLQTDSLEQFPIPDAQLSLTEKQIKKSFQNILASMHN
jgi:arylsulfatase A